jgi:NADH dehydrogenase FAD-containing subunit
LAVQTIGRGEGKMVDISVVGAGMMGAGMSVAMINIRENALERGMRKC